MKKLLACILVMSVAVAAFANNNPFKLPTYDEASVTTSNELRVASVAVTEIDDLGNDWRVGLAFPVARTRIGYREATTNVWLLTDAVDYRYTYLGAGIAVDMLGGRNYSLGFTAGYSANFSDLENIRNGQWGVGAQLTLRF
jgi:outer membrane protein assembly factor BamA